MEETQTLHNIKSELTCSICFDIMTEPTIINCGHIYCKKCIDIVITKEKTISKVPRCPTCREACNRRELPALKQRNCYPENLLKRMCNLLCQTV